MTRPAKCGCVDDYWESDTGHTTGYSLSDAKCRYPELEQLAQTLVDALAGMDEMMHFSECDIPQDRGPKCTCELGRRDAALALAAKQGITPTKKAGGNDGKSKRV